MKSNIYLFALLFITACSKCKKDIIIEKSIKGMVYNDCTDSGLAAVPVYFQTLKKGSLNNSVETISGVNGSFNFSNAQIHDNDDYSYAIHIPSKSGGISATYTEVAFNGTTMYFSKDQSEEFLRPHVRPSFLKLTLICQTLPGSPQDSIYFVLSQLTYHKNKPDMPFELPGGAFGDKSQYFNEYVHYPMGLYTITIDKWKSGIHTKDTQTVYIEWGGNRTYTLNW
jgi:hypothetical protein